MKPYSLPDIFPCLGYPKNTQYQKIDLDGLHFEQDEDVQSGLKSYLDKQSALYDIPTLFYGGYLEKRNFYTSSVLFKNESENRNIHLGVDVWADAGTPVYASLDGKIHSFAYNEGHLDYGGTIIVQYENYYVLYGHLSKISLKGLYPEKPVLKGQEIATLGDIDENGGWIPHLHIQIIKDIGLNIGDYPGLCSNESLDVYMENCTDPTELVV
ncbi:MAG: peptidoglycan DD-metalloendopeptidase family protein [Saprospiraceae bacterium]|nr:peptidoglycan DD-metalloendopeptidase family protein [Saprospiraceae bacterium]